MAEMTNRSLVSPGLPLCESCMMELIVRMAVEACGEDTILFGGPCCCVMQEKTAVQYYGTMMTNMASSASGVSRALRRQGKDTTCLCIAGDGTTADIAFGMVSAAAERGEHILYICYDNEAYMNTGIQRSSTTPLGAWTNTTPIDKESRGKSVNAKPVAMLVAEHGCAYCATANPAYMLDFKAKLQKAVAASKKGFAYLHVLSACPTGWKAAPEKAIEMSRAATQTNYYPLWEAEYGEFRFTVNVKQPKPIGEFTKYMKRFAHMTEEELAALQAAVDTRYRHVARLCNEAK